MAKLSSPLTDEWIEKFRRHGLFDDRFVPFKRITGVTDRRPEGDFLVEWTSWVPNKGKLCRLGPTKPETVDPLVVGSWFFVEIYEKLNILEEAKYRERVKLCTLSDLIWQRDLWRELNDREPLMSPNGMIRLQYAPLQILADAMVEKAIKMLARRGEKEESSSRLATPSTYLPKHKIVKQDVDKLLKALRSVMPEISLETAKRVYASLYDISFENVNKQYHYKGKKN
jgi:hypothetical protein